MAVLKCKMCGGDLSIEEGKKIVECDYCGTTQTIPSPKDENLQALFNRANTLRIKSEFDKAAELYEKIIQNVPDEPEAYWGLILCKYGIEYVEDPKTFKRVPTCHRTSFDSIVADDDYKSALNYADLTQKVIYESEAKEIDRLQKEIIALSQKEEPYDVFICYKETDDSGSRTQDSVIANDIYYQLKQEGFKVFYAAITLEDKIGSAYEPCIFAALNSAKVMLAVGTKPEYFNAVWVKNEWSRFLKMMKKDRSKQLIPCYKDMDAYELPSEFAHLQAQDMSKIGFINDLVRGIKKVITKDEPNSDDAVNENATVNVPNANVESLLRRVFIFLEDGNFTSADEYCEKVLDIEPENAQAYLGKLMAELKVSRKERLADCEKPFNISNNYRKVLRFGDEKITSELKGYITHINERNENVRMTGIFNKAVNAMNAANSEETFKSAAEIFETIPGFKDADNLATKCLDSAENCRKDSIYNKAIAYMKWGAVANYEAAIRAFEKISGWKDADEQITACNKKIEEIKEREETNRLERERQEEEKRLVAKKRKKIAAIVTPIFVACIAFVILLTTVIIPNNKYNEAVELYNAGKYEEAITAFTELNGYKDSLAMILKYELEKNASVGSTIVFGSYEQDNNTSNGKEEIEWLVLDKQDDKILIVTKKIIESKAYNVLDEPITWETSTLRHWLNNEFYNYSFSDSEKKHIKITNVVNDNNLAYNTIGGNDTNDKVFLLSIDEVNQYFDSDSARKCEGTNYAKSNGLYMVIDDYGRWWLRSPGSVLNGASDVRSNGVVDESGSFVRANSRGVRPAMWISLE